MSFRAYRRFVERDDDTLPEGYIDEYEAADWTLVQVLAWAVHRTPAWARRMAISYLRMKPNDALSSVDLSTARNLLILQKWPEEISPPEEAAEQAAFIDPPWDGLWSALQSGSLKANGKEPNTGQRGCIPTTFWQDADRLASYHGPRDAIGYLDNGGMSQIRYLEVRVRQADVLLIWPPHSALSASPALAKAGSNAKAESHCRKQLEEMMRASPNRAKSKASVRQSDFPSLAKRAFERAWTAAVAAAGTPQWSAAGRKPKSPQL